MNENPVNTMPAAPAVEQQPVQNPSAPSSKKRMTMIIVVILGFLLIIGVIFWQLSSANGVHIGTSQPTATPNILLATVGDKKIYRENVYNIAAEQYAPNAITTSVLKKFLDIAIERAILDTVSSQMNVTVSPQEINTYLLTNKLPDSNYNIVKYSLLKNKIIQSQIKSISAYRIGFWIASYDYPQIPLYAQQRQDGAKALNQIEQALNQNQKPLDITQNIFNQYPTLQSILALNGYIFKKTKDPAALLNPRTYTINEINSYKVEPELYNALISLTPGKVIQINRNDGSGGDVFKGVSVNSGSFTTYSDFLNSEKKLLLKTYAAL